MSLKYNPSELVLQLPTSRGLTQFVSALHGEGNSLAQIDGESRRPHV